RGYSTPIPSSSACGLPLRSPSSSSVCSSKASARRSTSTEAWSFSGRPSVDVLRDERFELQRAEDVVHLRQQARAWSVEIGFSLVEQTKIVTAASELGRNTVEHGKGGFARFRWIVANGRQGFRMDFVDAGPGTPDISLALRAG